MRVGVHRLSKRFDTDLPVRLGNLSRGGGREGVGEDAARRFGRAHPRRGRHGGAGRRAECECTACDTVTLGKYDLNDNLWGQCKGTGPQCVRDDSAAGFTISWGASYTSYTSYSVGIGRETRRGGRRVSRSDREGW